MNYFKMQNYLLKLACKKDKLHDFNYKVEDEHVILILKYYIVRIPINEWYLDIKKIFDNKPPIKFDFNIMTDNASIIKLTNESVIVDKITLRKFVNKEDQIIYINENYLKIFTSDRYEHLYFEGSTPKDPIIISSDLGEVLGYILPDITLLKGENNV